MSAKILTIDIERIGGLQDEVWEGKQYNNWIGPDRLVEPSRTICYAYRWAHEDETKFVAEWEDGFQQDNLSHTPGGGHLVMIRKARDLMDEADYIVGWNSKKFDNRHLTGSMWAYDLTPPSPWVDIDLMMEVSRNFLLPAKSMKFVSALKGMEGKAESPKLRRALRFGTPEEVAAAREEMRLYNIRDVDQTVELFESLRGWIRGMNLGLFEEQDGVVRCSNCLSSDIQYRGRTGNRTYTYHRFFCKKCGKWGRDRNSFQSTPSVGIATAL